MNRRSFRWALAGLALFVLAAIGLHLANKNYVYRALYHNFADIDDNQIFEERLLPAPNPQPWPVSANLNRQPLAGEFKHKLEHHKTIAFLVICHDSVRQEHYWSGYGPKSRTNSFSMSKSLVSMLVGVALKEGAIKSLDQPVADFLPEFNKGKKKKVTLRHLLVMSSGLNWDESYANPFSMTTEAYYGTDLKSLVNRLTVASEPGKTFVYKSGNTQVLAMVLKKATGKSLSEYASEKIWGPIGAEQAAEWSIDKKDGLEKAFCCLFSNARDFARLGQLYLNQGIWNGDTIVPPAYVNASVTPTGLPDKFTGAEGDFYGFHWWLLPEYKGQKVFYARGLKGQYIIVIPALRTVVVRLGESFGEKRGMHHQLLYDLVDAGLAVCK